MADLYEQIEQLRRDETAALTALSKANKRADAAEARVVRLEAIARNVLAGLDAEHGRHVVDVNWPALRAALSPAAAGREGG